MPGGKIIRDQRRQADAEIHVVAVAQFLRHAPRDHFALVNFRWHSLLLTLVRTVRRSMRFS